MSKESIFGSMAQDFIYERIVKPILFKFDPESAHHFVHSLIGMMGSGTAACGWKYGRDDLAIELFGRRLVNPVGLAAGFDKNGLLVDMLGNLGFGFAEIGSVCARPHGGNPRPRLFRLPEDEALINRLGLNGLGAEAVSRSLDRARYSIPFGINIAKTNNPSISGDAAVEDILYTFSRVKHLPVAFITINASCPNTAEGCIKESDMLGNVFAEVEKANDGKLPILVKLSPDSSDEFLEQIVGLAATYKLAGFVCGNTTVTRQGLATAQTRLADIGAGGLSGAPLKTLNLTLCKRVRQLKTAQQVIIGVGGVSSGQDVYEYICAGASAVELYTALVYKGPSLVKNICREFSEILKCQGTPIAALLSQPNSQSTDPELAQSP